MIKNGEILMNITAFLNMCQTMVVENGRVPLYSSCFFLLCKSKSNWKEDVSFKIHMAQVPYSRSWRKEHLSCTATTYMYLKIDSTRTVYCILHVSCSVNTTLMVYAMTKTKKRSCIFLSNKRFS